MGKTEFDEAVQRVKTLPSAPSNDMLLQLYGLFKQASAGDVTGKRPGRLAFRDRAKYDAWAAKRGTSTEAAQDGYVALVNDLLRKAGM